MDGLTGNPLVTLHYSESGHRSRGYVDIVGPVHPLTMWSMTARLTVDVVIVFLVTWRSVIQRSCLGNVSE